MLLSRAITEGKHWHQPASQSIYSRADVKKGSGRLTGCEGPDSRPEGDVAKLGDHLVVILKEPILRKGYLPPYTLEEFAFVARGSVLIVLEPDSLFLRVARARTRQGRSTFTRANRSKCAREEGKADFEEKIDRLVCDRVCKHLILETRTIKLGACCSHVGHKKSVTTLLFGCVKPRRGSKGGEGDSKSGDRPLNGVHNSLTKGNIDESGEAEAEVCDDRREGKGLYGKGRVKGRLMLVILPLSQSLRARVINCEEAWDNCS